MWKEISKFEYELHTPTRRVARLVLTQNPETGIGWYTTVFDTKATPINESSVLKAKRKVACIVEKQMDPYVWEATHNNTQHILTRNGKQLATLLKATDSNKWYIYIPGQLDMVTYGDVPAARKAVEEELACVPKAPKPVYGTDFSDCEAYSVAMLRSLNAPTRWVGSVDNCGSEWHYREKGKTVGTVTVNGNNCYAKTLYSKIFTTDDFRKAKAYVEEEHKRNPDPELAWEERGPVKWELVNRKTGHLKGYVTKHVSGCYTTYYKGEVLGSASTLYDAQANIEAAIAVEKTKAPEPEFVWAPSMFPSTQLLISKGLIVGSVYTVEGKYTITFSGNAVTDSTIPTMYFTSLQDAKAALENEYTKYLQGYRWKYYRLYKDGVAVATVTLYKSAPCVAEIHKKAHSAAILIANVWASV